MQTKVSTLGLAAGLSLSLCLSLCLWACGDDDYHVGTLEQAYKHGPPATPPPWKYYLTSYADYTTPACGGKTVNGSWYYSTGAYSFGCNTRLQLRANGKCVVVKVVDNGPAGWVETKAKNKCGGTGYIIDASPLVSVHLFGTKSAGWSDCYGIQVQKVSSTTPLGPGPCTGSSHDPHDDPHSPGQPHDPPPHDPPPHDPPPKVYVGDPCSHKSQCGNKVCFGEHELGFPGGMCTEPCTRICPDQPGKAVTFCIKAPWGQEGFCHPRCDKKIHPHNNGCRSGYDCVNLPRFGEPSVRRNVCIPGGGTYNPQGASAPTELGDLPNPEQMVHGSGCTVGGRAKAGLGVAFLLLVFLWLTRSRSRSRSRSGRSGPRGP
jgi:hypothetical protein